MSKNGDDNCNQYRVKNIIKTGENEDKKSQVVEITAATEGGKVGHSKREKRKRSYKRKNGRETNVLVERDPKGPKKN